MYVSVVSVVVCNAKALMQLLLSNKTESARVGMKSHTKITAKLLDLIIGFKNNNNNNLIACKIHNFQFDDDVLTQSFIKIHAHNAHAHCIDDAYLYAGPSKSSSKSKQKKRGRRRRRSTNQVNTLITIIISQIVVDTREKWNTSLELVSIRNVKNKRKNAIDQKQNFNSLIYLFVFGSILFIYVEIRMCHFVCHMFQWLCCRFRIVIVCSLYHCIGVWVWLLCVYATCISFSFFSA